MTVEHQPTYEQRRQVETMAGFGLEQERIARVMGIDAKTLRKHYRHELDVGADKANMIVAQRLFDQTAKNVVAAIFWLKARAGWRERIDVHHTAIATEAARSDARAKVSGLFDRLADDGEAAGDSRKPN